MKRKAEKKWGEATIYIRMQIFCCFLFNMDDEKNFKIKKLPLQLWIDFRNQVKFGTELVVKLVKLLNYYLNISNVLSLVSD